MLKSPRSVLLITLLLATAQLAAALEQGRARGSISIDGRAVELSTAVLSAEGEENLFDDSKRDSIIVLASQELGLTSPDDIVELSSRAADGELTALIVRLDGSKLVNVKLVHAGLSGVVILPANWFSYSHERTGVGALKFTPQQFDGHTYAGQVSFAAKLAAVTPTTVTTTTLPPTTTTLPPATTSSISKSNLTKFFVGAVMEKDEHQAVELIKLGLDPNSKDEYGMPVLSWAIMMCQPKAVQELVKRGADVNYERAPGLNMLQEAGACPEAAKILKAAGAK